jgi:hypothetical protein
LQLLKDGKVPVSTINLGVGLFFRSQKTDLFQSLKLSLDIACIFFDQLGKTPYMGLEVRILGVNDYYFPSYP